MVIQGKAFSGGNDGGEGGDSFFRGSISGIGGVAEQISPGQNGKLPPSEFIEGAVGNGWNGILSNLALTYTGVTGLGGLCLLIVNDGADGSGTIILAENRDH